MGTGTYEVLISGRLPNQQKTFQEENAGGKPDPRQAEIIWSGFKLVCPKYSLTCVVYVSNGTMSSDLPTEAGQSLSRE